MEYESPEKRFLPALKHSNLPALRHSSLPELRINEVCLKLVAVIPHDVSPPVDGDVDSEVGANLDVYV